MRMCAAAAIITGESVDEHRVDRAITLCLVYGLLFYLLFSVVIVIRQGYKAGRQVPDHDDKCQGSDYLHPSTYPRTSSSSPPSRSLLAEKKLPQRDNASQHTAFYRTTSSFLDASSASAPAGSCDPNEIHSDTANQSCRLYKTRLSNTASTSDDADCSLSEDINATKTIKRRDMLVAVETTSSSSHTAAFKTPGCCVSQMTSTSNASQTPPMEIMDTTVLSPLAGSDDVGAASPQAVTSLSSSEAIKVSANLASDVTQVPIPTNSGMPQAAPTNHSAFSPDGAAAAEPPVLEPLVVIETTSLSSNSPSQIFRASNAGDTTLAEADTVSSSLDPATDGSPRSSLSEVDNASNHGSVEVSETTVRVSDTATLDAGPSGLGDLNRTWSASRHTLVQSRFWESSVTLVPLLAPNGQ